MADNYCQFSEIIKCSGPERDWLIERLTDADKDDPICSWEEDDEGVWIYSEYGFDEAGLCSFICDWQAHFGLSGPVIIEWAYMCSKPRVGEFGGGAFICVHGKADWVDPRKYAELIAGVRLLEMADPK